MNAWPLDASSLPTHENGAFHQATIDPSAAFLHNSPTPDPNQFQRMFNGVPRNASPGFANPNQVIPSKRARPEDGISMSPRQAPGGLTSRSQTPHQVPYPGFQGPVNGAPQFPHPGQYQHIQQGASANVSQSPIMQDFDQQRMGTASPSPFSPAGPHVGSQMSPSQSDHPSRVNTPQNNSFMPGQPFPQGMGTGFSPAPAMTTAAVQAPMQAQFGGMPPGYQQALAAQQQQQRLHAIQMQNQNRAMNMNPTMGGRQLVAGMNAMANPQQMAAIRQMQQTMAKPPNPEGFMRSLQKFMMSRNLPLDPNPVVSGRPINLVQLYAAVMKLGGSKKVSATNMWPVISSQLQFPTQQFPMAAQEIRDLYQRTLAAYEQAFLSSQQKQFTDPSAQQPSLPRQPSDPSGMQFQSPAVKQTPGFEGPQQLGHNTPMSTPTPNSVHQVAVNGFATPTPGKIQNKQQHSQHRLSVSRLSQPPTTPHDLNGQTSQSPVPSEKGPGSVVEKPVEVDQSSDRPLGHPIQETYKPMVLPDNKFHGPIAVGEIYQLGEDISRLKPNIPSFAELGVIDIHALTMGIKSGMHAEIRVALDALVSISSSDPPIQLSLDNCDDLVDSLIECAEDQAEFLAEHAPEVSDMMLLPSYEEIKRGCHSEWTSLAPVAGFGSTEYKLDRAVDRLVCITTILRNFSFIEPNHGILSTPPVVEFISTIIRYLGTRNMLLRTHQNTLDFMKDTVIYLSNVAQAIHLPSKEEALCLLQFLLSFAPFPGPTTSPDGVMFTAYNPSIHKYTPAAVDCLAKLLARDEPNRTYFRAIFSSDGASTAQQELLTRTFGLAICPVPNQPRKPLAIADIRKVFIMQGLLAADILSGFAEGITAKSWLESVDGFAIHLLRLSCLLSTERVPPPLPNSRQTHAARAQAEAEAGAYGAIINRGLAILQRLAETSKHADTDSTLRFASGILPKKESLLGALLMPNVDPGVVRQLITYARLAE
ncbi:putative ARID/BRIGHT domain protein (SWI1) [Aspergillus stella-maris]|uniref:putative ARID/BRIGHT domain protein (SWI1) n=1 Tax=Aspergillus stella-maris TaxID=1810926 RepID=UPI003CCCFB76